MTAVADAAAVGPARAPARLAWRGDVQGLRAVAVALVLLYHAGVPGISGGYVGVDVFFVVSGYVVTGVLVRDVLRDGRVGLGRFWAGRARRLLPAATAAGVGTVLLTWLALPVTQWVTTAGDARAAGLFVMNLHLADRAVDYLAAGGAASPFQHFWSLGVEAQFYVLWACLVALLAWLARRRGLRSPGTVLAALVLGSALLGVWRVDVVQDPQAYFSTLVRVWELGAGGLLAWYAPAPGGRAARWARPVAAAGLAGVLLAAVLFDGTTRFPGTAALLPVLGAVALLWSGAVAPASTSWLAARPLQAVGDASYALYLWHWPLLVVAAAASASGELSPVVGVVVVVLAWVPAWLSTRYLEPLVRRGAAFRRPPAVAALVVVSLVLTIGSAAALRAALPPLRAPTGAIGAEALGEEPGWSAAGVPDDDARAVAGTLPGALQDVADVYGDGCHQGQESAVVLSCTYGRAGSGVRIALVGDSHAAQWQPALRVLVEERGWELTTYTKSACPWAEVEVWRADADQPYPGCRDWVQHVTSELLADRPTMVVTSTGPYQVERGGVPVTDGAALSAGLRAAWSSVSGATPLVVLQDTPFAGLDVPTCLAQHLEEASTCAPVRADALDASAASEITAAAAGLPGAHLVDLTDDICPQPRCAPVIGGLLVYRDHHHLTASYARTLEPALASALDAAVGDQG